MRNPLYKILIINLSTQHDIRSNLNNNFIVLHNINRLQTYNIIFRQHWCSDECNWVHCQHGIACHLSFLSFKCILSDGDWIVVLIRDYLNEVPISRWQLSTRILRMEVEATKY